MEKTILAERFSQLKQVETTSEWNGYPRNLQNALVGFESWDEAQEIANEYDLQLIWLKRREGQQLWTRDNQAIEPLYITSNLFGDDYNFYTDVSYFRDDVAEEVYQLGDDLTSEHLKEFAEILEEVEDAFAILGEDEVVVTYCGRFYRTQKIHPIEFDDGDGHYTKLAAIEEKF